MKTSPFGKSDLSITEKPRRVRDLFSGVAANYDAMNDAMSLGVHRLWKDYFISLIDTAQYPKLLDVAGGTGDIAARFIAAGGESAVIADPTAAMMHAGKSKHKHLPIEWIEAMAENLPFDDGSFPLYTISFGLRNVTDIEASLAEAHRVLEIGGQFLCLEFAPKQWPLLSDIYKVYGDVVVPALGEFIAHDRAAYEYLTESIRRFPAQEKLQAMMEKAGFAACRHINLSGGICAVHQGFKV